MIESISLGNVLSIIAMVVTVFVFYWKIVSKISDGIKAAELNMTAHIAESKVRMEQFEGNLTNLFSACASCYLKGKHEKLTEVVDEIKVKQDKRIAEFPLQYESIKKELERIGNAVDELLEDKRQRENMGGRNPMKGKTV